MDQRYVNTHHIIERYLAGQLAAEQVEEFEVCCLENPEVAKDLEYTRGLKLELCNTQEGTSEANNSNAWLRKIFRPAMAVPYLAAGFLAFFAANLVFKPVKIVLGEFRDWAPTTQPVPRARTVEFELDLPPQSSNADFDITVQDQNGTEIQRWKKLPDGAVAAIQMDTRKLEQGEYEFVVFGQEGTPLKRYRFKLDHSD